MESTAAEAGDLPTDLELRTVTRVIDGDTLILDGGGRVRLIGVDTPETVHPTKPVEYLGKEAGAFTKRMVEGQEVYPEDEPDAPLLRTGMVACGLHQLWDGRERKSSTPSELARVLMGSSSHV